jgi:hypothetical protein
MGWTDNHCRYEFEIVTTSPHGPTIKDKWLQLLKRPVGPIHHGCNGEKKIVEFRSFFGHFSNLGKFLDFTLQLVF